MTLTDYLNQKHPVKLPIFSVELEPDEYIIHSVARLKFAGKITPFYCISVKAFNHAYICNEDGNLWTMDDDGNKKARTVFKIKNL